MEKKNVWKSYKSADLEQLEQVAKEYKLCLDAGKTERECVWTTVERIEKKGYRALEEVLKAGEPLKAGDKVYAVCMDKMIAIFHIGRMPLEDGMNILGAHIVCSRIDV